MTDQELKEIRERFTNRLHDSECYSEFLNHHEPDVARLLAEVERLKKERFEFGMQAAENYMQLGEMVAAEKREVERLKFQLRRIALYPNFRGEAPTLRGIALATLADSK